MTHAVSEIIIGPESDHWQCMSVTHSLTHCRLVNLIDVTQACEGVNSKLVEVATVADVNDEDRFGNSFFADLEAEGQKGLRLIRL